MNFPTSIELAKLINTSIDAVDKSALGPFFSPNPQNLSQKQINQIAFSVFSVILSNLLQNIDFEEESK